jgi:hypothetical protein
LGRSEDGRIWLLNGSGEEPTRCFFVLDLADESIVKLERGKTEPPDRPSHSVSPDGRWCVMVDVQANELVIWDLARRQQRCRLRGLKPPVAFAADGNSMVATVAGPSSSQIQVLAMQTLTPIATLTVPGPGSLGPFDKVRLSDDGAFAMVDT